jgi:spore germination protein KC
VFGEEFARGGIREAIDFFSREGEVRETNTVVVAKGVKASEVVLNEFELERMPAEGALGIMRIAVQELSTTVMVTLNDFLQMLETEGHEAIASRAELVRRPPSEDPRGELKRETISVSGRETGAAAFKGDKLVGWLDKTQTRGLQWVRGKVRSGIIVIEQPEEENKLASIEILRADSTVTPKISKGRPSILIRVGALGNLGEVQEYFDPMESQRIWTSMERRMAEAIRHEIEAALDIAKHEFNSDIFGFGAEIRRKYPKEWMDLKDKWDEEFPKLDVEIKVETSLRRAGLTRRSMRVVRKEEG